MAGSLSCASRRLPAGALATSGAPLTGARTTPAPAGLAPAAAPTAPAAATTSPTGTLAGARAAASSSAPAGGRRLASRTRARRLRARGRGSSAFFAAFTGRASVGFLAPARATFLAASSLLVHRGPSTPFRFAPRNATLDISLFDLCGLPLLFGCIRRLVTSWHRSLPPA